jgi:uncharacterized protein YdaU (DUF1376 family)
MTKTTFEQPWWYRQVPRDFMSSPDVQIMSAEECGCYFFLLQHAWLGGEDCTLPNEPERLAKLGRVKEVSPLVLSKFKLDKNGRFYNERLREEWKEALKRSKDGKKAISARWEKEHGSNTVVSPPKNEGTTTNNYTKTNTKTLKKQVEVVVTSSSASDEASLSASSKTQTPAPGEAAVRVAEKLAAILRRENLKPAKRLEWEQQAERLLTKFPEPIILAVMQWSLVDSPNMFWRGRVYSMKHFAGFFRTINQQYEIRDAATGRAAANPLASQAASLSTGYDFSAMAKGDV